MSQLPSNRLEIVRGLHADAAERCTALLAAERRAADGLHAVCQCTWNFGQVLADLREAVGHGHWITYIESKFLDLGETEKSRRNRVAEAIAFFRANPNAPSSGHFSIESIRKCVFHLAPEKERPQLPGNESIAPAATPLTFINNFSKWSRQVEIGIATLPEPEILREQLAPVVLRIAELGGKDWLASLLA